MSTIEFNQTLLSLEDNLKMFAYSFTRNEEEAKDLTQETLLKAFRYKKQYKPKTNFKAWVFTIMRNQFINEYRKKSRSKTIFDNSTESYLLNSHTDNRGPEGIYTKKEIDLKIESLEENYKIPFMMHVEGYKYKEISEKLNIPIGTVKSRIFISRQRLIKQLPDFQHN
jgi:RNA polymerase sigma factor (sigma-70 family)